MQSKEIGMTLSCQTTYSSCGMPGRMTFISSVTSLFPDVMLIQRQISQPVIQSIHVFSDASERAYGSVAYLRTVDQQGEIQVDAVSDPMADDYKQAELALFRKVQLDCFPKEYALVASQPVPTSSRYSPWFLSMTKKLS